jgi:hypothetical protein
MQRVRSISSLNGLPIRSTSALNQERILRRPHFGNYPHRKSRLRIEEIAASSDAPASTKMTILKSAGVA